MINPEDSLFETERLAAAGPLVGLLVEDLEGNLIDIEDIFYKRVSDEGTYLVITLAASAGRD